MRLSLYTSRAIEPSEEYWTIVSGQPEADHRSAVPGGKQYWGKHLDGLLQVNFVGNRLDIVLSFNPEINRDDHLPVVDTFENSKTFFLPAARRLLADPKFPVNRIAFGGFFLEPSPSRESDRLLAVVRDHKISWKLDFKRARELGS